MKTRIEHILPLHKITTHSGLNLYIADYKNFNIGDVVLIENEPSDIKCVHLSNPNSVRACFDGFKENALPIRRGYYSSQCECVIFPENCDREEWVLFIETKYANNREAAFNEIRDYPNQMTSQIIETVKYFRQKGIIEPSKKVHAIVSFPNLVEEFNSTIFRGDLSIEDILFNHKIIIRGTNNAHIISDKRIKLTSN